MCKKEDIWTTEEIEILIENFPYKTNNELCSILDRSNDSIRQKASKLNLHKSKELLHETKKKNFSGEKSNFWKCGKYITTKGYIAILKKNYPGTDRNGYILEHRYVMEQYLGRSLTQDEIVHHKNGNKQDNRIENLELMTNGEHSVLHNTGLRASEETREKLSIKAKERYKNPKDHPAYKNIDVSLIKELRKQGVRVEEICKKLNISKKTYYVKLNENKEE